MPRTLSATPIASASDTTTFIPGPAAYPPLIPGSDAFTTNVLTETPIAAVQGTFPGTDVFPGADVYPGRGTTLAASPANPRTLTEVPA